MLVECLNIPFILYICDNGGECSVGGAGFGIDGEAVGVWFKGWVGCILGL